MRSASTCEGTDATTRLDIANYRTDGSGRGTVDVIIDTGGERATRTLAVARDGRSWNAAPAE
ncbi:hypothetical protein PQS31_02160 [Luteimonas sp BLCC-B24]|uniref:hypothetical protein n=1 Tax=Luteimonas sp. BLCC-B24 TaxID=3025317 RepID=UPI00234C5308|nr:hypothetical protein [Luteimonas sp. BLCC-B24]MDC7805628.1 hypothetical protein [Luteimonas sp. BLCC-B24]